MTRIDDPQHDREVGTADSTQDNTRTDDTRISAVRPLISPALLQDELPVSPAIQTLVEASRAQIADVLHGRDDRLLIVVGPCSIHDHGQAMEYARQLRAAVDQQVSGGHERPATAGPNTVSRMRSAAASPDTALPFVHDAVR